MKKIIFLSIIAFSCKPDDPLEESQRNKIGCLCNDGTRIVWDENLMRQTGWTTGNPCYDKGGIKEYIYK
jgi:hypothetical protein